MSKVAIQGDASGTGTFTIAAPNSNTDRTLTLPDAAGTVFVGGQALSATTGSFSGNVTLGSSVLETPTGSAPAYLCRAWVNFNGTGTVAIGASGNVASITDNGTGTYTVNFTTAMQDTNFSFVGSASANSASAGAIATEASVALSRTTSSIRLYVVSDTGAVFDSPIVNVAIFR